ncbi:hypothetical protein A7C99_7164 [Trichophyton rubrum]|uniref:Uncharacterized protein n=1 Tax=Trichophyton rubrum TaxID=5551 RepID=A0A178ERF2_TRIRU|nr:hypothetical protein A7C99_7164 [Trichophyton rubrum]
MILDTDLEKLELLSPDASDLQSRHSTPFLRKFSIPRAREWLSRHCIPKKKCDSCQHEKERHKETQELIQLECEKLKQYLCQRGSQLRKGYELQMENVQYKWHRQQAEIERLRAYITRECQQQKEYQLQNYNSLPNRVVDIQNQKHEHPALSQASLHPSNTQEATVKKMFEYMCYIETHDNKKIKEYCCRGCQDQHSSTASFSQRELDKAPSERKHKKVTRYDFAYMFFNIDYPLCPHTQLYDALAKMIFTTSGPTYSNEIVYGWADKSDQCRACKTHISLEILPSDTPGNDNQEWCALKVRRTIGRLYSPLEEDWLAQAYAYDYSPIDEHNKLSDDWFRAYWRTLSTGSPSLRRPGFDLKTCRDPAHRCPNRYAWDPIRPSRTASDEQYCVRRWVRSQSKNSKARVPGRAARPHHIQPVTHNNYNINTSFNTPYSKFNCLLDKDSSLKLADFGRATTIGRFLEETMPIPSRASALLPVLELVTSSSIKQARLRQSFSMNVMADSGGIPL